MKNRLLAIAGLVAVCLLVMAGASIGGWYALSPPPADASRNSSGTMSAANGPYVSGTVINSAQVNARLADIESEITNSADRNGRGGFLAAVRGIDGTLAAPAFSWTSETGSGQFRNGAGDVRMAILGALRQQWTSTGTAVTGTLSATGNVTASAKVGIGGAPSTNLLEIVGASEPALTIQNTAMTNSPALFVGMNSGNSAAVFQTVSATNYGYKFINGAGTTLLSIPATGGATIGSNGTAITASIRGTVSWTPGSLVAGACTTNTITATGAAAGADVACNTGGGLVGQLYFGCYVTANTCNIQWCNPPNATSSSTPASGTYSCRVFNP